MERGSEIEPEVRIAHELMGYADQLAGERYDISPDRLESVRQGLGEDLILSFEKLLPYPQGGTVLIISDRGRKGCLGSILPDRIWKRLVESELPNERVVAITHTFPDGRMTTQSFFISSDSVEVETRFEGSIEGVDGLYLRRIDNIGRGKASLDQGRVLGELMAQTINLRENSPSEE